MISIPMTRDQAQALKETARAVDRAQRKNPGLSKELELSLRHIGELLPAAMSIEEALSL